MSPPADKKITAALRAATLAIFDSDRDSLSVKTVRNKVVEDLELDEKFFLEGEWKTKSKDLIKGYAVSYLLSSYPNAYSLLDI